MLCAALALAGAAGCAPDDHADHGPLSQNEALQRVVDEVLAPAGLTEEDVAVYGLGAPLDAGSEVRPVLEADGSAPLTHAVDDPTWFFWVDHEPFARFRHPTQFVYVDDATGEIETEEQQWYAVVDETPLGPTDDADDPSRVFGAPVHPEAEAPRIARTRAGTLSLGTRPRPQADDAEVHCEGNVAVVINSWPNNINTKLDTDNMASALTVRDYIVHRLEPHPDGTPASKAAILSSLDALTGDRDVPLCQVLIYYSGHGTSGNLIMGNDKQGNDQISVEEIATRVADIDACDFSIILDACETGQFVNLFGSYLRDILEATCKNVAVLVAAKSTELAYTDVSGGGAFTNALLDVIQQTPQGEPISFDDDWSEFDIPELGWYWTQTPQRDLIEADEDCEPCGSEDEEPYSDPDSDPDPDPDPGSEPEPEPEPEVALEILDADPGPPAVVNYSGGELTVDWEGNPTFPITVTYQNIPGVPCGFASRSGCGSFVETIEAWANPIVIPETPSCFNPGDADDLPATLQYEVILQDANGVTSDPFPAPWQCVWY